MDAVNFYSVASQHNRWLSVRQTAVAQNIANANTPGYKAVDVQPFDAVLEATGLNVARTQAAHLSPTGAVVGDPQSGERESTWDVVHSGNSVSLEEQLLTSSEVTGQYARNTSVMKSLYRMMLAAVNG